MAMVSFPPHLDIELEHYGMARLFIRHQPRAKRYGLRIDPKKGPVLVIPRAGTLGGARKFVKSYQSWLIKALGRLPDAKPFMPGAVIPLRGIDTKLVATGGLRGVVQQDLETVPSQILVPGDMAHFARKVTDWLKKQAKHDINAAVRLYTDEMGLHPKSVRIGDASTRWGSCSSAKNLCFSWRLILAPPEILDYLVVHEMAHLRHMDHSPHFWALVARYCADFKLYKSWLKKHGHALFCYGKTN